MTRFRRISPLLAVVLIPLAGCGRQGSDPESAPLETVGNVGVLPAAPLAGAAPAAAGAPVPAVAVESTDSETTEPEATEPAETSEPESTTVETTEPDDGLFAAAAVETDPARRRWLEFIDEDADPDSFTGGAELRDLVEGRRVLMIGDSVMASTSPRYGGEMCAEVTPRGWDVEIDAETGRFIDFGDRVLDRRLDADFDVAVVMLGNNYGANQDVYEEYLRDIVDRLEPRPTVLLTVTLYQPNRKDVNDTIYDIAMDFENVRVIDWAGETAENPELLNSDGLHLSDLGRAQYAELIAEELGRAPEFGEGDCLGSDFTDDSAGTTGTTPGQVTMPPSSWPTATTPRPTTTSAGGGGTTVPGSTPDVSDPGGGGTTLPDVTLPPTTGPNVTDPPTTAATTTPPPPPPPPPPTTATTTTTALAGS